MLRDLSSVHKSVVIPTKLYFLRALFTSPISFSLEDDAIFFYAFFYSESGRKYCFCMNNAMCSSNFYDCICNCINPSPSTALNGLTSDTTNATKLFNTVFFITFDKLMSDLLKYYFKRYFCIIFALFYVII